MIQLTDPDVYKLGEQISDMVWNDYDLWPEKAQRTIGYQIIRSADSIFINIAEGYGRYTLADRKTFIDIQGVPLKKQRGDYEKRRGEI